MVGEGIPGRGNSMGKGAECPGCNNKLLSTAGDVGMSSGGRQAGQRGGFFTLRGLAFVLAEPGKDDGSCILSLLRFLG